MPDNSIYRGFDSVYAAESASVYRLCFLIARDPDEAHKLTFDSFLRLGGMKEDDLRDPRMVLYRNAVILCEDWMARKIRKKPYISENGKKPFPFPYEDNMKPFLLSSYARRMALGLCCAGMSPEEGRKLAGYMVSRKMRKLKDEEMQLAKKMIPPEDEISLLTDQIYERFAQRNVRVENAIHGVKSAFDRVAPYLAFLVLLFFAFCFWFVRTKMS